MNWNRLEVRRRRGLQGFEDERILVFGLSLVVLVVGEQVGELGVDPVEDGDLDGVEDGGD